MKSISVANLHEPCELPTSIAAHLDESMSVANRDEIITDANLGEPKSLPTSMLVGGRVDLFETLDRFHQLSQTVSRTKRPTLETYQTMKRNLDLDGLFLQRLWARETCVGRKACDRRRGFLFLKPDAVHEHRTDCFWAGSKLSSFPRAQAWSSLAVGRPFCLDLRGMTSAVVLIILKPLAAVLRPKAEMRHISRGLWTALQNV